MKISSNFRPVGFNLGGWLSQSPLTEEHVASFIREKDFQTIANWGFNSVRLPIDAEWLFEKEGRGPLDPKRFTFLLEILGWAKDAGLLTILDLHQVPWHSFAKPELENLWKSEEDLSSFCHSWAELTNALKGVAAPIWFDLLNEPTAQNSGDWNKVAAKTVQRIRAEDKNRILMVESTQWGSIFRLEDLVRAVEDPHLVYSFHFYLPMLVTHQQAPWWEDGKPYREKVIYPGLVPNVGKYLKENLTPATRTILEFENRVWNKEALRELLRPVQRLLKDGKSLYCGEFGVFERAPRESRLNWTRDVVSLFSEFGVGWGYWNYKWLDFGVWPKTPEGQTGPLDQEMLQILQKGI